MVTYIKGIDPSLYARHAFPLPWFGKVTNNLFKQENLGLLMIREYALVKLLMELWYCLQEKCNERRAKAHTREEVLIGLAHQSHAANLCNFA